jgi:hypothetical protein
MNFDFTNIGSDFVLEDVNNDGYKDIFTSVNPFFSQPGYSLASSPVVCDLNNDGQKDILVPGIRKVVTGTVTTYLDIRIFAVNLSGQLLPGVKAGMNSPILADVDGDPEVEILAISNIEGKIYGINMDGSVVPEFPLRTELPFL